MKSWLLVVFLVINPVTYIADINSAKEEAKREFLAQKYEQALSHYLYLINQLKVDNEEVFLNLAHTYYNQERFEPAQKYYNRISKSENPIYQSKAFNQLGIIACQNQDFENALAAFRSAIEAYRQNYEARYNYELVKNMLEKYPEMNTPKPQNSKETPKPQENKPQSEPSADTNEKKLPQNTSKPSKADKDGETTEGKQLQPQKLEALKMNREKAENLLNALRNQEVQYIQQLPRQLRQKNRKPQKRLPDW